MSSFIDTEFEKFKSYCSDEKLDLEPIIKQPTVKTQDKPSRLSDSVILKIPKPIKKETPIIMDLQEIEPERPAPKIVYAGDAELDEWVKSSGVLKGKPTRPVPIPSKKIHSLFTLQH